MVYSKKSQIDLVLSAVYQFICPQKYLQREMAAIINVNHVSPKKGLDILPANMFPIKIIVRTNKEKTRITKEEDNVIYLDVHAQPKDNKANIEILKFLKKHFKTNLRIIKGLKSKEKIIDEL